MSSTSRADLQPLSHAWLLVAGCTGTLLLMLGGLLLGSVQLSPAEVLAGLFDPESSTGVLVWQFRVPRVVTALVAGAALSVGGAAMQTLFGNPLAGPDVLGISAGASLGVAAVVLAGGAVGGVLGGLVGSLGLTAAAALGSMLSLVLLLGLANRLSAVTLLLLGLMLATALTGVVSVLHFLADPERGRAFVIWAMGSVRGTGLRDLPVLTLATALGTAVVFASAKGLDALRLGPEGAEALGVAVRPLRLRLILATALLTGAVTAACGPIGFVGVAVPHLASGLLGTRVHKVWLPMSAILGAVTLLTCDLLLNLIPGGRSLPINAVTAALGAPVVAWVILRNQRAWTI